MTVAQHKRILIIHITVEVKLDYLVMGSFVT